MSRRRPNSRRQRLGASDLVWGLVLGGIGIGIVALVVLVVRGSIAGSGESSLCDRPLVPLGQSEITAESFASVDQGLAQTARTAAAGNLPAAEQAFFGPVHNFTHNVDPPLRSVDPQLAKSLCQRVLSIENEFSVQRRPQQIAIEAESLRQLLREAAQTLGFPPPS